MERTKTLMSALSLICIHTSINVVYKTSQIKGGYGFSSSGSLVVSELIKLGISIFGILNFDTPSERKLLSNLLSSNRSQARVLLGIVGLAVLYALNNNLAFRLFTLADPATISLFKSMTSFTTAITMFVVLGRPIWRSQWFAVLFQCLGLIVFQYDPCKGSPLYSVGTYMLLATAVAITTISSVWNDHVLKNTRLSLNGVNAILYASGASLNFIVFIWDHWIQNGPGFFEGYTSQALLVIFFNSIIGIAITLVYKYGDALVKTFASAITAVLLLIISSFFFGLDANLVTWTGGVITVLATYMYVSEKGPVMKPSLAEMKVTGLMGSSPNLNMLGDSRPGSRGPSFQNLVYLMLGIVAGMIMIYTQVLPQTLPMPH
jgi:hypothetical protein